jgi:GT2 family glycosyltransferase
LDRCPAPPITFLFRRSIVERIGLQDTRLKFSEDYDYWLRAAFAGFRFAVTPDSWSFYRRRKGQKTEFRINSALSDYACYTRALRYVRDEPFRSMLLEKLARMQLSLGHYYMYLGDGRRARKLLHRSAKIWPAWAANPPRPWVEWLARLPGGPLMYKTARRLKGLQPPFAFDPNASSKNAAA